MNKIYTQIEPNFIQTSEIHENGSFTSGIIRRLQTKIREVQDGTEEVSIGFDEEGVELFETQPKFITETFSPWDELDPDLVTWLDIPAFEEERDAEIALQVFKSGRQRLLNEAVVDANGFMFDADEVSIGRLSSAILSAIDEDNTFNMQWSLADTATGVMTNVTLADLKLAHKLAVIKMSEIWGKS